MIDKCVCGHTSGAHPFKEICMSKRCNCIRYKFEKEVPEFDTKSSKKIWPWLYRKVIVSKAWYVFRDRLFKERGKVCEECGSLEEMNVHHKNYIMKDFFNPDNLIILCRPCHKKIHNI